MPNNDMLDNWQPCYIGLGSNIGDKAAHINRALHLVGAHPDIRLVQSSRLYHTPPWGDENQDWFLNGAILIETRLSPLDLLDFVLETEERMGRKRERKWGPRIIDLDLLIYGETDVKHERLTLPHPYMHEREFVLIPLQDIAPELMINGQPIAALIDALIKKNGHSEIRLADIHLADIHLAET